MVVPILGEMMSKRKKVFKILKIALCAIALLFGVLPIIYGANNIGNILLLVYGILMLVAILINGDKLPAKILNIVIAVITAIGIVFMAVLLYVAYFNGYDKDESATVVVMGCMVRDGNPSLMLTERLNVAYEELSENPDYSCIVSGGLTSGEPMSEAEVMKTYLVSLGIDSERIYVEDQSTSTLENINYSTEIIEDESLPSNIIIATDGFHQFRSVYYSNLHGYDASSVSSISATGLVPGYYIREMLAILHMIFLGS